MNSLSQSTIEKLGYYVYLLKDPRDYKVFYVGKGFGNRINHHILGALDERLDEKRKILKIREIVSQGLDVELVILRHGLTEKEAFEIESAMIDFIGMDNLTNEVLGHHSWDRGIMKLEDIKIMYEAQKAGIDDKVVLININKLYHPGMSQEELYRATRKDWRVSFTRVQPIKIVLSVYRGIVREVFSIDHWLPSPEIKGRYVIEGSIAPKEIREKYLNKSVAPYWKHGSQNPVQYANC